MGKFIFVVGGVVSGLGKGITAASIGLLLKHHQLNVFTIKMDPYMNVDPGTMSPYQHGEVFVTADGSETDLDLGHYERFINVDLDRDSNFTAGQIYQKVLRQERKGEFAGKTVQVIPHITDTIKNKIYNTAKKHQADVNIIEVGGTIGDIESLPFLEAIRQIKQEQAEHNVMIIMVTLVPYLPATNEVKTKPTQHAFKALLNLGLQADAIVLRSDRQLTADITAKVALFCNLKPEDIWVAPDAKSIYQVPIILHQQNCDKLIIKNLQLPAKPIDLSAYKRFLNLLLFPKQKIRIAMVGKYIELPDAYLSVIESIKLAATVLSLKIDIKWIAAKSINPKSITTLFADCAGIIVPGGFGDRGIEGLIDTAIYAMKEKIPYLGLCLGMQVAAIGFARTALNLENANSAEFKSTPTNHHIFHVIKKDQQNVDLGGTLRLGNYDVNIVPNTKLAAIYNNPQSAIKERHRHRYEFNNDFVTDFENNGMKINAWYKAKHLVEGIELVDHPFFIGVQYHPEFKSRPNHPHPLFTNWLEAVIKYGKEKGLIKSAQEQDIKKTK